MGTKYITVQVQDMDTGMKHGASQVEVTTTYALKKGVIVNVGTSEEEIDLELGAGEQFNGKTPLALFARNHDDTNYVELGFSTGVYYHRLLPEEKTGQLGMPCLIPLNSGLSSIYVKANTAACDVELEVWYKD